MAEERRLWRDREEKLETLLARRGPALRPRFSNTLVPKVLVSAAVRDGRY